MRLAYYKDEYEKYLRAEEEARARFLKAEKDAIKTSKEKQFVATKYDLNPAQADAVSGSNIAHAALAMAASALNKAKAETKEFEGIMEAAGYSVSEVLASSADAMDGFSERTNGAAGKVDKMNEGLHTTVDRLKEINAELKQLRKADPQTDEEFEQIQAKIKALTEERNKLTGKGRKNGKNGKNVPYLKAIYKGRKPVCERILKLDAESYQKGDLPLSNLLSKYCSYMIANH